MKPPTGASAVLPTVSVVIPNYNYARFLPDSVESALQQDYADTEVIVVDDVSTDHSVDVIRSYGDRLTSRLHEVNGGHAAAFNSGFAASSGDIVLFLDADDYLYPNAVAEVVEAFADETAQVQFRLHLVDEAKAVTDVYPAPEQPFDEGDVVPDLVSRGRYATTVTSGLAFRREALEAVLPVPEDEFRQGADGYLATLAPLHGDVKAIDRCLGAYRQHGGNHSAFEEQLATRARWRTEHDFHRFEALARHLEETGLAEKWGIDVPDANVGLKDPMHVEERLASLCVDAENHPVADDTRLGLAAAGAAASLKSRQSMRRRAMLAAWFLSVGVLPGGMAKSVLSWKLEAATRPQLLKTASKSIRRAMG